MNGRTSVNGRRIMKYDKVASGAAGAAAGGATGATALYFGGVTGLSAAGITSGLAAIGGSMVVGIGVMAALPLAGGLIGYAGCRAIKEYRRKNGSKTRRLGAGRRHEKPGKRQPPPMVHNQEVLRHRSRDAHVYDSFAALVEGKRIASTSRIGKLRAGARGEPFAHFRYEGRRWRLNADSRTERVMQAYECLKAGEDPFVETTTRGGTACLDLIDRLRSASQTKGFYVYEVV